MPAPSPARSPRVVGAPGPLASVVIPAHQEEATIARCLEALLGAAAPGELDVVVVCNGCTDASAERARATAARLGHRVRVLELDVASKAAALRAGDAVADGFPRLYLDADVECPTATVRRLAASVAPKGEGEGEGEGAELAVPARRLDLSAASAAARSFYRTWEELPWVAQARTGRGALMLSHAGRSRVGAFPDVVADDRWVTSAVPSAAVRILDDAPCTVRPPARLRDVVRVRSRIYAGNSQLAEQGVAPASDRPLGNRLRQVVRLVGRPAGWPGVAVFAGVTLSAKVLARTRARNVWARDDRRGQA
ncbi:glycosyltransferase [Motilibacter deserti]|uniref:4,4'-diaponeurosporenoate glycosyltransferase n=1 Tax=Motilibacter deserti TaxID=2714956 RepID=A0ABX0GU28_9ACTN|nr:glycosyltransferase family 2 protein [Motilibacter deserti]